MIIVPTPVFFPGKGEKFEGAKKALDGQWEVVEVKWDPILKMVVLKATRLPEDPETGK